MDHDDPAGATRNPGSERRGEKGPLARLDLPARIAVKVAQ
jgi:hypothetical protein